MKHLITTHYTEQHHGRRMEIEAALSANSSSFDRVHVLAENSQRPSWLTADWNDLGRRQTYRDAIEFARGMALADDIVVIANTDIVIPKSTLDLISAWIKEDDAFALSRWDFVPRNGLILFDRSCSQDTWVFRGAPRLDHLGGEFHFGVPGCDNRFAAELADSGYRVTNPSIDLMTIHYHVSQHRTSNDPARRIPLPYLWIKPHTLNDSSPEYTRPTEASKKGSYFL